MWFRFFFISWRWASRIIFIFLFCFNFVAEAYDHSSLSLSYDCEDVSSYYAQVEHLEGEALKKKLNSIISEHQSLSYKEVILLEYFFPPYYCYGCQYYQYSYNTDS